MQLCDYYSSSILFSPSFLSLSISLFPYLSLSLSLSLCIFVGGGVGVEGLQQKDKCGLYANSSIVARSFISSRELKTQVIFSDPLLSVVCLIVCTLSPFYLFLQSHNANVILSMTGLILDQMSPPPFQAEVLEKIAKIHVICKSAAVS